GTRPGPPSAPADRGPRAGRRRCRRCGRVSRGRGERARVEPAAELPEHFGAREQPVQQAGVIERLGAVAGCLVEVVHLPSPRVFPSSYTDGVPFSALAQDTQAMIGKRLGSWVLDRELGRGGMGCVYLGHADVPGDAPARAAVKVLAAPLAADPGLLARFEREIDVLRKLDHPNIVRLLEAGAH